MSGFDRMLASTAATPHKSRGVHIMSSSVVATSFLLQRWIMLTDAVEQHQPFNSLHTIVNLVSSSLQHSTTHFPARIQIFVANFCSKKHSCCTMPAPLQVGCQMSRMDLALLWSMLNLMVQRPKRRQKSFVTGRVVAAKGPSLFSVRFENGRTGDHGSNAAVFVPDPQVVSPPGSVPLQQRQVPTTLPPSLIAAQAAARALPLLEETIPKEVLAGTAPTSLLACLFDSFDSSR
jgi:hypothetical protein